MTSYGLNVQSRAAKNFGSMTARQMAALFFIFGLVAIFRRSKARTNPRISRGPRSWPMVAWLVPDIPRLSRMDGAAKCRGGWSTRRTAAAPFTTLAFHPEARATRTQWASAIRWSDKRDMVSFQTSSYPPPFYVPSAIGILIGRTDNMTVVQTLMLSRILTGTTAVMLTAIAIACAGSAAPWLFAVMTLPMSLSLMASSSQDALLFACNAFAGALMVKALRSPDARNGMTLACLGLCLGLIGMARPAYGALAVAPLGLTKVQWHWRIMAAVIAGGCTALWSPSWQPMC